MSVDNSHDKKKSPDDVDLLEVYITVIKFFIKNGGVFLVFSLIGLGLGGLYFKLKPSVYKSKMVAECMSLPDVRVVDLILVLDNLRENADWKQLSKLLEISPEEAAKIKKLEPQSSVGVDKAAKGVDDYLLPTATTSYLFSVIISVKDNAILPKVQAGIIAYLSNNEFSKTRVNRFLENRLAMINYIDYEMNKLDSLNALYATKVVNSKSTETALSSPADYKVLLINLKEKRMTFEDELKFAIPVRIFQGFTAFPEPVSPVLIYSLLYGFLSGFGVALMLILVRDLRSAYLNNAQKYE